MNIKVNITYNTMHVNQLLLFVYLYFILFCLFFRFSDMMIRCMFL
jgi:hypothetical protein